MTTKDDLTEPFPGQTAPDRSQEKPSGPTDLRERLAGDRTVLANERTALAWLRTGIGALAAGLAVEALQGEIMPPWLVSSIALLLTTFSVFVFLAAGWRLIHVDPILRYSATRPMSRAVILFVDAFLILGGVLSVFGIVYTSF